jgi:hypothetical protein
MIALVVFLFFLTTVKAVEIDLFSYITNSTVTNQRYQLSTSDIFVVSRPITLNRTILFTPVGGMMTMNGSIRAQVRCESTCFRLNAAELSLIGVDVQIGRTGDVPDDNIALVHIDNAGNVTTEGVSIADSSVISRSGQRVTALVTYVGASSISKISVVRSTVNVTTLLKQSSSYNGGVLTPPPPLSFKLNNLTLVNSSVVCLDATSECLKAIGRLNIIAVKNTPISFAAAKGRLPTGGTLIGAAAPLVMVRGENRNYPNITLENFKLPETSVVDFSDIDDLDAHGLHIAKEASLSVTKALHVHITDVVHILSPLVERLLLTEVNSVTIDRLIVVDDGTTVCAPTPIVSISFATSDAASEAILKRFSVGGNLCKENSDAFVGAVSIAGVDHVTVEQCEFANLTEVRALHVSDARLLKVLDSRFYNASMEFQGMVRVVGDPNLIYSSRLEIERSTFYNITVNHGVALEVKDVTVALRSVAFARTVAGQPWAHASALWIHQDLASGLNVDVELTDVTFSDNAGQHTVLIECQTSGAMRTVTFDHVSFVRNNDVYAVCDLRDATYYTLRDLVMIDNSGLVALGLNTGGSSAPQVLGMLARLCICENNGAMLSAPTPPNIGLACGIAPTLTGTGNVIDGDDNCIQDESVCDVNKPCVAHATTSLTTTTMAATMTATMTTLERSFPITTTTGDTLRTRNRTIDDDDDDNSRQSGTTTTTMEMSTTVVEKTDDVPGAPMLVDNNQLLGPIIGGVVGFLALVLIAILLAVVITNRRRRKKRQIGSNHQLSSSRPHPPAATTFQLTPTTAIMDLYNQHCQHIMPQVHSQILID